MVVGAGANVLFCSWAPYVFAPGALLFVAMQLRQRYEGSEFTIRRLRRIQIISDFLFLVAGLLMMANQQNFLGLDQLSYIKYVHNNWVVVLLVAAVLQKFKIAQIFSLFQDYIVLLS